MGKSAYWEVVAKLIMWAADSGKNSREGQREQTYSACQSSLSQLLSGPAAESPRIASRLDG